jgi:hypothetical protein
MTYPKLSEAYAKKGDFSNALKFSSAEKMFYESQLVGSIPPKLKPATEHKVSDV